MNLDKLSELEKAATGGNWEHTNHRKRSGNDSMPSGYAISQSGEMYDHAYVFAAEDKGEGKANAEFIAAARNAMPHLIAVARAANNLTEYPFPGLDRVGFDDVYDLLVEALKDLEEG